jgi:hypothetical protein
MAITISTDHFNERIQVDDVLDAAGSAVVALGLINHDGSDTFPGRTLTPDEAEELAAGLARAASAARASEGLAPTPLGGEHAYGETLTAIRAAVPLPSTIAVPGDGLDEQARASGTPRPGPNATPSAPKPTAKPRASGGSGLQAAHRGLSAVESLDVRCARIRMSRSWSSCLASSTPR